MSENRSNEGEITKSKTVCVEDPAVTMVEPDTMTPLQFFDRALTESTLGPEKRLMLSVLEDAIASFQRNFIQSRHSHDAEDYDVESWLESDDMSWPFSFASICQALDMEPEYLRRGLGSWGDGAESQGSRGQVYRFPSEVIEPVLAEFGLEQEGARILVNPTGRFEIGGPKADTGLTGRKIIVGTYGGACPHGGGAFSGKDPSKVDRSAAYMARYVAKNVVAAGLARRCTVQLAYAVGVAEPISVYADLHGTGRVDEESLERAIQQAFDLTPDGIIRELDLLRPIYRGTAAYGHFGRSDPAFTWERTDRAAVLREAAGSFHNRQ